MTYEVDRALKKKPTYGTFYLTFFFSSEKNHHFKGRRILCEIRRLSLVLCLLYGDGDTVKHKVLAIVS